MALTMPTMSLTTSRMSLTRVKNSRMFLRTGIASLTKPGMAAMTDLTMASMAGMLAAAAGGGGGGGRSSRGSNSGSRWADFQWYESGCKKKEEKERVGGMGDIYILERVYVVRIVCLVCLWERRCNEDDDAMRTTTQ
jgi:hypothetical protein